MSNDSKAFLVALMIFTAFMIWEGKNFYDDIQEAPKTKIEVTYDCRLAEISPDYPALVKEKCRKLMMPKVSGVK